MRGADGIARPTGSSGRRPPWSWATPTTSWLDRAELVRAGPRRGGPGPCRRLRRRCWSVWETTASAAVQNHYVEIFDLSRRHTLYLVVLDRRRHPPTRRGADRRSSSATAAPASWSTPTASCPTTCRWCWSTRPDGRPERRRRAAAGVPAQSRAAPVGAGRQAHPVRRRGRRGVRDPAGRLARRPAGRDGDGRGRAADRDRRPGAVRSPAAARRGR